MPYVAIKTYPKEDAAKQKLVERINQALLEVLGCPEEAVSISVEEILPQEWEERVVKPEMEPNRDHMMILSGEKQYSR